MNFKSKESNRHIVDVLFVLALFGVFAASALMLVTIGADVYKKTVSNMNENFEERTAYSYISEKIRQNDVYDSVEIGELEGVSALLFIRRVGDDEYCTCLYLHDGYLKELFIRRDSFAGTNLLQAGQDIMPLSGLSMEEVKPGLIRLTIDTGSRSLTLYASLRSGTGQ
ncbi:MAG: DUF4860 domain-containing protein [Lachnospiraceae bacterium]|nr:DUF4860 domain-containing protein [Lachnospiraceae bacterium]